MQAAADALILGAGPAGVALACRLAAQGLSVDVIAARRSPAWEGLSPRVVVGLRRAGCDAAVAAAGEPARRAAHWNGQSSTLNHEHLVERARFDVALRRDLRSAGARLTEASVASLRRVDGLWQAFDVAGAPLCRAAFLVEARGRRAPSAGVTLNNGPRTVAIARIHQGDPGPAASAAASFADGWVWMAALPDGRRLLQFVVDAALVPPRVQLSDFHASLAAAAVPEAAEWIARCPPLGEATARDATAALRGGLVGVDWLRIGDAAFTSDPLSGHGVHSALGSAFAAVAVINSLRASPDALPLVQRFVEERSADLFDHAAAVGNAFYRMERRWAERLFWRDRSAWPTAPLPAAESGLRRQPVVVAGRIVEREVLVTPRLPRGVLTIEGVELAPLLRMAGTFNSTTDLAQRVGHTPAHVGVALNWLRQNGFLHSGGGLPLV
jgi:menaquinone-9 beta-reductase